MGFFKSIGRAISGIAKAVGTLGAIAIGAAIGFAVGGPMGAVVGGTAALALTSGSLTPTPDIPGGGGGQPVVDTGVRIQLQPNTENKVPVVYGSAFVKGVIVDARISDANKVMTYVMVLSEKTTTGTFNLNEIYWNDIKLNTAVVISGATTLYNTVTSATNADGTNNTDFNYTFSGSTPISNVEIHFFKDGSENPLISGHPLAYNIVPGWDNTWDMSGLVFVVMKIRYNAEKNITGLPTMTFKITNSLTNPGDVWNDYLTNTRYGAGLDSSEVDSASVSSLNTSGEEAIYSWRYVGTITTSIALQANPLQNAYVMAIFKNDSAGAASALASLEALGFTLMATTKYKINGIISPENNCMANVKTILLNCNSWGTYDYRQGKWKAIVNQAATNTQITNAFVFNDTNILSEISLTSTGLDQLYNSIEIEYPAGNIKDQKDYITLDLPDTLRNDYEPDNQLKLNTPLCNNSTQAIKLGRVYLKQAREDIAIEFTADYSALQVNAGEVVKITNDVFGWSNKLFRVMSVRELESEDGMLAANLRCIEYNADIYTDEGFVDFVPAPNTNIPIWQKTTTPDVPEIFSAETNVQIPSFTFKAIVPEGVYNIAEFWYSADGGSSYQLGPTIKGVDDLFLESNAIYATFRGFAGDTYYIKVRVGKSTPDSPTVFSNLSAESQPFVWDPVGVQLSTSKLTSDWFPSPVIVENGLYGQVRRLQVRNGSEVVPVSTSVDDDGMANNSWRLFNNNYSTTQYWTWTDISYDTTYNVGEWTLTTISDYALAASTQTFTPVLRYKDAVGSVSSFTCSTTEAWKKQSYTSGYSQDGRSIQIDLDKRVFTRPTGFTDSQTSNYTPASINIKARQQNIVLTTGDDSTVDNSVITWSAIGSDDAAITLTGSGYTRSISNTNFGNRDWVKVICEVTEVNSGNYGEKETFHDEIYIYRVREGQSSEAVMAINNDLICLPVGGIYANDGLIDPNKVGTQINMYVGSANDTNNWAYQITSQAGINNLSVDNGDYKGRIFPGTFPTQFGFANRVGMIHTATLTATKSGFSTITKPIVYHRNAVNFAPTYGQYGHNGSFETSFVTTPVEELVIYRNTPSIAATDGIYYPQTVALKAVPCNLNAARTFTWTAQAENGSSASIGGDDAILILTSSEVNDLMVSASTYVDFTCSTTQEDSDSSLITYSNTTRIYKKTNTDQFVEFFNPIVNVPTDSSGNILNYNGQASAAGFMRRWQVGYPRYYEQGILDQTRFFSNSYVPTITGFTGFTNFSSSSITIFQANDAWIYEGNDAEVYMSGDTATITIGLNIQAQPTRYATLTFKKQIQGS
jgi:hypothetical protein